MAMENMEAWNSQPRQQQSAFERFSKHRLMTYSGSTDPIMMNNWLDEMEKLIELTHIPDAEKFNCVTYYLKEEANHWWKLIKSTVMLKPTFAWKDFKEAIEAQY
ncbi:hypothetical protein vseg_007985 [Gypsophila vaccaria]